IETVYSNPAQSVRSRSGELQLDEDGNLAGDVRIELTGHWNALLRETLEDATDSLAAVRELMGWEGEWMQLNDLRVDPSAEEHGPARVTVRVRIASHAVPSGHRIVLEPPAWWAHRGAGFAWSRRVWPVEFPFAWPGRDSLRIRLPAGWKCESALAPRPVSAPGVAEMRTEWREQESGAVLEVRRTYVLGYEGQ